MPIARFGFSAQQTFDLAQAHYERHKLISYPRTDTVSPTNCVQQHFGAADVGQKKATILVNRVNLSHELSWRSEDRMLSAGA